MCVILVNKETGHLFFPAIFIKCYQHSRLVAIASQLNSDTGTFWVVDIDQRLYV